VKIAEEFAAGMQSGLASPGRRWFTLALANGRVAAIERVKAWVGQAEEAMAARMLQTNFYDQFVEMQHEQGVFGTSVMLIEEDAMDVFFCRTLTAGQYAIGVDHRGRVNRLCRKLSYTAGQLAEDFGAESLPEEIRDELRRRESRGSEARHWVRHMVQPNQKYEVDTPGPAGMAWQSLWWMPGKKEPDFLRVSGYHEFPAIVGRWKTVGDEIYGRMHPAETALDDAATLQAIEVDARAALELATTPPLLAPSSLQGKLDNRPRKMTFYDAVGGQAPVVQPLYAVSFNFAAAEEKIARLSAQIERAFYVDLFRMWSTFRRQGITATQVQAEEQEKSYILAPVTMRQTSDVLDKAIIRIFSVMLRAGLFPEAPPELAGEPIRIEYVSEFAMLQKRASQAGIETLLQFAGQLMQLQGAAGMAPDALDKIDADEVLEAISDMYGGKSGIVLGDDAVAQKREARAAQARQAQMTQMAAQAAELAPKAAGAAKDMSQTQIGGASALDAFASAVNGEGAAA
jgi:hypothetical protein